MQRPRDPFPVVKFLLIFGAIIVAAGTGVLCLLPKNYKSRTTLELKDHRGSAIVQVSSPDPSFIQSQLDILQSTAVLFPVLQKSDLLHKWARANTVLTLEEACYQLRVMMSLKPIRGTDQIEISVWSGDSKEATALAKAVAQSYRDIMNQNVQR